MLRFKLKELIADKSFKEDRRITIAEIAEECEVNRMTLSKIANKKGCTTNTDNLDKLCRYFDCAIEDLVEYIEDEKWLILSHLQIELTSFFNWDDTLKIQK